MKSFMSSLAALAMLVAFASCQRENFEPVQTGENTVTYTIEVPTAIATKALGDNVSNVTELHYEVWRTADAEKTAFTEVDNLLYHRTAILSPDGSTNKATITLELINDQNFTVLFWAQVPDSTPEDNNNGVYSVGNLTNVTVAPTTANQESYAAFSGVDFIEAGESLTGRTISLKRAVAQLNIATTNASLLGGTNQTFVDPVVLNSSSVTVEGLSTSFNVATQDAGTVQQNCQYAPVEAPATDAIIGTAFDTDHTYVAMNYVGFVPASGTNVKVSYVIGTSEGTISNTIENVPVKANYRTNIIGNLITSKTDYTVSLDAAWGDDGKSMEVLTEGLVKNINGDYEVSAANGLAYAINNLFAQGGTFYILNDIDMTGVSFNPATVPAGVTTNIVGAMPVVTRSSATTKVIITGLSQPMIAKVAESASVSFAKVEVQDYAGESTDAVLVAENDGVVAVSDCSAENNQELVDSSEESTGTVLDATTDEEGVITPVVKSVAELQAAAIAGITNVTASDILLIEAQTEFDGNGIKLTSTATRAINVKCTDEVTIKNLEIVTSTNCERAINIIEAAGTTNIENVKISGDEKLKFAVNMASNVPGGAVVNIKNSDFSAWKAIQEYASGSTLNVENSTLTGWAGIAIYGSNTTINVTNSVLVGVNTYPSEETQNTYSTIAVGRNTANVIINVNGGSVTAKSEAGKATQWVYGYNENCSIAAKLDTEFILIGDNAKYLNIDLNASTLKVRAEYADEVEAQGFMTGDNGDGTVSVYGLIGTWDEFTAAIANNTISVVRLGSDIAYDENYSLKKNVTIDLNGHSITAPLFYVFSTATIKNGTINGHMYARTGCKATLEDLRFSGTVSNSITEGHLQVQGGCDVYAKNCVFAATTVGGSQTKPLSIEASSSGTRKFENCDFTKPWGYKKQVYINPMSGTTTLNFTNCKFNGRAANIMFAATYPLTNLTMSGCDNTPPTLEIQRAKSVVTDDEWAHLRSMIDNNSFTQVRIFYTGGSSEYFN